MSQPISLHEWLEQKNTVILDVGLATSLEAAGLDLKSALWSAQVLHENPAAITQVHLDHFTSGADLVITASYQAAPQGLQEHLGLDLAQSQKLIRDSVQLAKDARDIVLKQNPDLKLFVAGSVGPYGAYLANGAEYTGDYDIKSDDLKAFHRPRVQALVEAGADVLACETMPSFSELQALTELLEDEFPTTQYWVSCTLRNAQTLSDGTPMSKVVKLFEDNSQVIAIGYNCIPLALASPALGHLQLLTTKPLIIYPNSGEQWDATQNKWYGESTGGQDLADLVRDWHSKGALLIGGCCRMSALDVSTIKKSL